MVRDAASARPHLGLMLVPVVAGLVDRSPNLVFNDGEGLDGILVGLVGFVERELFFRG